MKLKLTLPFMLFSMAAAKLVVDNDDFSIWTIPDDAVDIQVDGTTPGAGLIGGGSDCVKAFEWQISHANRGDFVILRASGADDYNPFVYDLSKATNQTLNSVTTIKFKNGNGSGDKTIRTLLQNAEAIFFAGGDQNNYINYWMNTPIQTIVNEKLKTVTIAGTSAGLAIQGNWIYSAEKGSAYSDESLENPYNRYISLTTEPLFSIPFMTGFVTDTHFFVRDRMGRMLAMLGQLMVDREGFTPAQVHAVGVDETTALLLDVTTGDVRTVGVGHAYVCGSSAAPAVVARDTPLTFEGVKCTRLSGPEESAFSFATHSGEGVVYDISVVGGHYTESTEVYGPAETATKA